MASNYELESFVAKFRQLFSAGYDAKLTLSSEKGQAEVSFYVTVPSPVLPNTLCRRRRSSSYYHRLKRLSDSRNSPEPSIIMNADIFYDIKYSLHFISYVVSLLFLSSGLGASVPSFVGLSQFSTNV